MHAARFQADCLELAQERMARGKLDRRDFLRALALLGIAPALGATAAEAAAKELVLVNFGGDAVAAWGKAWGEPFTQDTGIKVTVIGGEPVPGALKAMVESGKITWDLTDGDMYYLPILSKQGIIQKYDYSKVDKAKVRPEFVSEFGCANYLYSYVCGYDTAKTGGKTPNGFKDFLNFKDFPGKRSLYKWLAGSLEAVLLADGVAPAQLYPLDVKRAFGLIRAHKDQFVLWGGGAASQQLFRDGEIAMGIIWCTRATVLDRETKGRLTWTWDQGIVAPGVPPVLVRNPGGPVVWDFVASMQKPERQIELLRLLGNGPANPAAGAMLTPDLQKIDCGYESNYRRQIPISSDWYAQNYDKVQDDFLDLMSS
jgi:putative spermidine/putrescine transport system substrate-binding protein